jgi:hypothetical protein
VGGDTYQLMFVLEKVKFTCHWSTMPVCHHATEKSIPAD